MTAVVWGLILATLFAMALAAQMRFFISHALRKALAAKFGGEANDAAWRSAISDVGRITTGAPAEAFLTEVYCVPLSHLKLARRVSLVAPGIVLGLAILARVLMTGAR